MFTECISFFLFILFFSPSLSPLFYLSLPPPSHSIAEKYSDFNIGSECVQYLVMFWKCGFSCGKVLIYCTCTHTLYLSATSGLHSTTRNQIRDVCMRVERGVLCLYMVQGPACSSYCISVSSSSLTSSEQRKDHSSLCVCLLLEAMERGGYQREGCVLLRTGSWKVTGLVFWVFWLGCRAGK